MIFQVKEATLHQKELVADATISLGNGIKNSVRTCSEEAGRAAQSISEFVDVKDILKSIQRTIKPGDYAKGGKNVVYAPTDLSKKSRLNTQKNNGKKSGKSTEACDEDLEEKTDVGNDNNGDLDTMAEIIPETTK